MIDQMLRHKTNLHIFKRIDIISSTFCDHNAVKLEINHKKNTEKHARHGSLITCYYTVNESIMRSRKKSKDTLKQMKMRTQQSKICGILGKQS